jgi:methylated-DNA-[protein]-cysteine S-methyltransferase
MDCKITYASPLGDMLLTADDEGLTGAWFVGQKYFATRSCDAQEISLEDICEEPENSRPNSSFILGKAKRWLDQYFAGIEPNVQVPLHLIGTDFQQEVWAILLTIPYGQTSTYGDIAKLIAEKRGIARMSAQAVGGAVGHNPISIIVPCHRVLGSNGSLTGYAGGIERKISLLSLEGIDVAAQ